MNTYTAVRTYQAYDAHGNENDIDDMPNGGGCQDVFDSVEAALLNFIENDDVESHLDEDDKMVLSVGVLLDRDRKEELGYIVASINEAFDIDDVEVGRLLNSPKEVASEIRRMIDSDRDVFSLFAEDVYPEEMFRMG